MSGAWALLGDERKGLWIGKGRRRVVCWTVPAGFKGEIDVSGRDGGAERSGAE